MKGEPKAESSKVYVHIERHNMEKAVTRLLRRKHGREVVDTLTPLLERFSPESLKALSQQLKPNSSCAQPRENKAVSRS
jgi:hypothetical protein